MALVQRTTRTRRPREEEPDEEPRGRRGRASRDEEPPARSRGRGRDPEPDDDAGYEDEDAPPARGRARGRSRDEEPEDDAPRGRRARPSRDEDDEPPARGRGRGRSSRDDDEDDGPASNAVQSGWGAGKKLKTEGGSYANEFTITGEPQLIAFLEDEPYAVYKQHWVNGLTSTRKKSFICLGDKTCPLCRIGEDVAKKFAFNIAVISGKEGHETAEIKSLIAGPPLFDSISDEHEGSDGPLTSGPWTLHKVGDKKKPTYKLKRMEGRKLDADWMLTEEDVADIVEEADLELYTAEQHKPPSRSYLQEIADEVIGSDD